MLPLHYWVINFHFHHTVTATTAKPDIQWKR